MDNYFVTLNKINVNDKTEKKGKLTYLSWSWAWGEVKKLFPDSTYTVYENADGWNYFTDGKTCWVKTGVTVNGIEHIEYLPVMDFNNKSIPAEKVTSYDVNKTIQRSLTKAIARHGLGLYIYSGEDLPDDPDAPKKEDAKKEEPPKKHICADCGKEITDAKLASGREVPVAQIVKMAQDSFGVDLCYRCGHKRQQDAVAKMNAEASNGQ